MFLHLNPQSGVPVYRQMARQLQERIAAGQLADGAQLPSVRELSAELHVNPLTVAKVYQFLERDGLVEFRRGQGTFVAADRAQLSKARQQKLIRHAVEQVVSEARHLGLSLEQLQLLIQKSYERKPS
ncbi:MAG: GntR family transcriptional regulator [Verrucomicrobiales bacterium]|jgi:GntR family transcriptional regulator|nr:GntR family transcriptional regulator [Verrucomicrobiales bacterium]